MITGRSNLVARERSYHGSVGFAREVSYIPLWSSALVPNKGSGQIVNSPRGLAHLRKLPVPECGLGVTIPDHDCSTTCLADAEAVLDGAAAVIMDYSQGAVMPSPQYQDKLAKASRDTGALWIADETVTAFGRLGHPFAFHRGESRPDMVTLGKGLTGGAAPAGAIVLSRDIVEALDGRRWTTSSTFRGHPLAVAAISATMKVISDEGLVDNAATLGAWAEPQLRSIVDRHACVTGLIGEGLLWIIELAVPDEESEGQGSGAAGSDSLVQIVHDEALRQGVFIGIFSGQGLWLVPPLIIDQAQLGHVLEVLDAALDMADQYV
jgi:adenosylmethionine-8-amino-7-oxononanoate aminotransferase